MPDLSDAFTIGRPTIPAIILATECDDTIGQSVSHDKDTGLLLSDLNGEPLVTFSLWEALESSLGDIIVILGPKDQRTGATIRQWFPGTRLSLLFDNSRADDLQALLRSGLEALPDGTGAVMLLRAHMPFVSARSIDTLLHIFWREQESGSGPISVFPDHEAFLPFPSIIPSGSLPEFVELADKAGKPGVSKAGKEKAGKEGEGSQGEVTQVEVTQVEASKGKASKEEASRVGAGKGEVSQGRAGMEETSKDGVGLGKAGGPGGSFLKVRVGSPSEFLTILTKGDLEKARVVCTKDIYQGPDR